jgi:hypothetical protein
MPRPVFKSPKLELAISDEQWEKTAESSSGGCVIAEAIKRQYPHLSNVSVDMATVRASDRKRGLRFTYLTPPEAQMMLLSFDQGFAQPGEAVTIKRAVKIEPIIERRSTAVQDAREKRRAELAAKKRSGAKLTRSEATTLANLTRSKKRKRPRSPGKTRVSGGGSTTVYGGRPIPQGANHPNLLRGRDRHYGAKQSRAGKVFEEAVETAKGADFDAAVEEAVAARLKEQGSA